MRNEEMESSELERAAYPAALVDWAGHHSGGVKRLLDANSGQPNKQLLRTNLLSLLETWTNQLAESTVGVPRIVLLVGGPGNGKTEAIESTIRWLDESLGCNGQLIEELSKAFHPPAGIAVPRLVHVDAGKLAISDRTLGLDIVQDASATAGHEGKAASVLLVEELGRLLSGPTSQAYLCCVNRGVLDDALIHTLENNLEQSRDLLEAVTRAVSLAFDAPSCWPLEGYSSIAVWPMDAESLLVRPNSEPKAPQPRPYSSKLSNRNNGPHPAPAQLATGVHSATARPCSPGRDNATPYYTSSVGMNLPVVSGGASVTFSP